MHIQKSLILIFLICILSLFLRIYLLDKIPNSISADEAAFGYNAYSISKTGKDEFGHKYPLYFQSFDDYKNPLFGYLLIPFVKFFDLTDWSIRLPSVLLGVGVILIIYLLVKKLTGKNRLALITSFFAAISPWLIQYSRVAIDMELGLFLSLVSIWLFLKGRENKNYYLISFLIFGLDFYAYHSSKIWILAILPVLLLLNYRFNKYILLGIVVLALMVFPYFRLLTTGNIGLRPYAISVFSNQEELNNDAKLLLYDKEHGVGGGKVVHNRRLTVFNQAINGYLHILNPELLFSQSRYNQIRLTRLFFLWQIPLILIGALNLLKHRNLSVLIFSWLLFGLIPGGMTILPVYDRRILLSSFPLLYFSAYGFYTIINYLYKNQKYLYRPLKLSLVLLITTSFYLYMHNYFIHGRNEVVYLWGNGIKDVVSFTKEEKQKFDNVIVSIKLNQPLIFFLFYEKYPPDKYLQEGGTISGGYLDERNKFGKYKFKNITKDDLSPKNLFVWSVEEVQPCLKPIHTIKMSNGTPLAHIGIYNSDLKACQN